MSGSNEVTVSVRAGFEAKLAFGKAVKLGSLAKQKQEEQQAVKRWRGPGLPCQWQQSKQQRNTAVNGRR